MACALLVETLVSLCGARVDTEVVMSYTLRPVRRSSSSTDYLCPVSFQEVPFFTEASRHFDIQEVKLISANKNSRVTAPILLELSPKPALQAAAGGSSGAATVSPDARPFWARWLSFK